MHDLFASRFLMKAVFQGLKDPPENGPLRTGSGPLRPCRWLPFSRLLNGLISGMPAMAENAPSKAAHEEVCERRSESTGTRGSEAF